MKSLAAGLAIAVFLAACSTGNVGSTQPPGTFFHTTIPTHSVLPVTLLDTTGLVVGIEPWSTEFQWANTALVQADPADPNAFVIYWIGVSAEGQAFISFSTTTPGYALHLEIRPKPERGGGTLVALPRAVRIETSRPVPIESIVVTEQGF
ncbi:MAG: hypothetical protein FIA92_00035 [Chloroflexi bacterium]|nr:hypothetical protein [Chloroflexota bacterium]